MLLCRCNVISIVGSKLAAQPGKPTREASSRCFCVDVWSGPCNEVYACLSGSLEEWLDRKNSFG